MGFDRKTRRAVLVMCYDAFEAQARRFSVDYTLLGGKPGYELAFAEEHRNMEVIRELINEEDAKDAKDAHA